MRARCLKPFHLSRDGVTSTLVAEGAEVHVPPPLAPGLFAEGFIAWHWPAPPEPAALAVEPADEPEEPVETRRYRKGRAKKGTS